MTRAELVEFMARAMACHFSMNRMPHMSGDPLARLGSQERRRLDDATTAALAAIEAAGFVCVPREATLGLIQAARGRNTSLDGETLYHGIYRAMLAASLLAQEARDAE